MNRTENVIRSRSHPYVKLPIVICFSKDENDYKRHDDSVNVIQNFNYIFGVNDDQTSLFSLKGSKNKQRQNEALKDMGKMFSATLKAAKAGDSSCEMEAAMDQFEKTKASTEAHLTHGLSKYSDAADAVERKFQTW